MFDPIGQLHAKNHMKALQFLEHDCPSTDATEHLVTIEQERTFMQWKRDQNEIAAEESFHEGDAPGTKKKLQSKWALLRGQANKVQLAGEAASIRPSCVSLT